MSTETQKVDVRIQMAYIAERYHEEGKELFALQVEDALEAITKLIEATQQLVETVEPILTDHGYVYVGKLQKAKRAIARVGGAACDR